MASVGQCWLAVVIGTRGKGRFMHMIKGDVVRSPRDHHFTFMELALVKSLMSVFNRNSFPSDPSIFTPVSDSTHQVDR